MSYVAVIALFRERALAALTHADWESIGDQPWLEQLVDTKTLCCVIG